ncbi:MAG: Fic family protein [Methylococcales symbiont of Hymedesmia sp. n. MRB-2018]|nr:MAG: Fic family protein [Methylococcales symbiont of Hymedesmia sp. n. MRB-2018]
MSKNYPLAELPLKFNVESKAVFKKTIQANRLLAELKGVVRSMPNQDILISSLALQEAKDSSEIENIVTTYDELYRANAGEVKISNQTKEVYRYRQALYCGFDLVKKQRLLLKKHIIRVQQILENNDAGIRTQTGTVLKNQQTGKIIYTPPQGYQQTQDLMDNLEKYINQRDGLDGVDPLIKMAIIHYQFESIHPFYDGNGRTGRIVNILYLILNDLLDLPILYLSSYIINTKQNYYHLLGKLQHNQDTWQEWIIYILDGVTQTAQQNIYLIDAINQLMYEQKQQLKTNLPKIYSKDLLEMLFKQPYIKIDFLADGLNMTRKTAATHLKKIENVGILQRLKSGRDVYFINTKLVELLQP